MPPTGPELLLRGSPPVPAPVPPPALLLPVLVPVLLPALLLDGAGVPGVPVLTATEGLRLNSLSVIQQRIGGGHQFVELGER